VGGGVLGRGSVGCWSVVEAGSGAGSVIGWAWGWLDIDGVLFAVFLDVAGAAAGVAGVWLSPVEPGCGEVSAGVVSAALLFCELC
jgi:hypothetical protein